jgi:hypothetical protein
MINLGYATIEIENNLNFIGVAGFADSVADSGTL